MEKQTSQKIAVQCIVQDIFKNIFVAIAIALSLSFITYIAAKINYSPTYTSSTTFVVSSASGSSNAYANMTKTNEMIESFRTVINSQILKKKVCESLKVEDFPGDVLIEVVPETNLITMKVTADKPDVALYTLKSVLDNYPEVGKKVLGDVILDVFEDPSYPANPDSDFNGVDVMAKVFILSFGIMIFIFGILSYLNDTVKSEGEVEDKLDTKVFGILHHENQYKNIKEFLKRNKKKMVLSEPAVSFGYEESVKKITTKLIYNIKRSKRRVVLITSTIEGEGKSTIAMNLCEDMARRGKKVLLIEGNLKKPGLSKVMHLNNNDIQNWGEYITGGKNIMDAVYSPNQFSFSVLINNIPMENAADIIASKKVKEFIDASESSFDVVVIDAPYIRKRIDTEIWASYADASILVVRQNFCETKYINDSIDILKEFKNALLGCIFNDAIKSGGLDSIGYSYGYGYGSYGKYGHYGKYGKYNKVISEDEAGFEKETIHE